MQSFSILKYLGTTPYFFRNAHDSQLPCPLPSDLRGSLSLSLSHTHTHTHTVRYILKCCLKGSIEFDPRSRRNLLNLKWSSIAHSLSLSTSHRPDMIEILLKTASHPFTHLLIVFFLQIPTSQCHDGNSQILWWG